MRPQFLPTNGPALSDPPAEENRRIHQHAIEELQNRRAVSAEVFLNVELPDATDVRVVHGYGREVVALNTAPRSLDGTIGSTGRVYQKNDATSNPDPANVVVLHATGWGETVFVDVVVL